jgi:hypothetical protein
MMYHINEMNDSKFIRSQNFRLWFKARRKEALAKLEALYHRTLLDADINTLLHGKQEIEMIDLYLRVREQLVIILTLFSH